MSRFNQLSKFAEDYRGLKKYEPVQPTVEVCRELPSTQQELNELVQITVEICRGLPRTKQELNEPFQPTVEVYRELPRTQQEPNEPVQTNCRSLPRITEDSKRTE